MVHLDKLKLAFKMCRGPYPWRDFETMITQMGYVRLTTGKTGGSRRKFRHPDTMHKIICHEPHDGEMGTSFVKAMRENLEEQGLL